MWRSIAPPVDVVAVAVSGAGADIGPGAVLNTTFHIFILHHWAPFVLLGEYVLIRGYPHCRAGWWGFPLCPKTVGPGNPMPGACHNVLRGYSIRIVIVTSRPAQVTM